MERVLMLIIDDKTNQIQMRLLINPVRFFAGGKKKVSAVQPAMSKQQLEVLARFKQQRLPSQLGNKVLPCSTKKNTLITSALPYVNNVPHLGNIIGALLSADIISRYRRLIGQNVLFICGTDQYGTATQIKAKQQNKTPQQICTYYHQIHKQIYQWFNISYNHFGRTSSNVHKEVVQEIFMKCYQNGFFYQKQMEQLHCGSCDMFLADRFVVGECKSCGAFTKADQCDNCNKVFQNPHHQLNSIKCSICNHTPKVKSTTHLFSNFQQNTKLKQKLQQWLFQQNKIQTWSANARGETKYWIKNNVRDRCMTRDLKWGIPVPLQKYKDKVFYVWFDAPIGYISITKELLGENYKEWWKSNDQNNSIKVELMQFMGKDNIMFHSILFPSTLLSASLNSSKPQYTMVNKLSVTEYLRYQGGKFSKSSNRGVFGNDCAKTQIDSDVWRWYLLSNRPQGYDCQFLWQEFMQKNNKQLMNSIGNLYNRILKVSKKDFILHIPSLSSVEYSPFETNLINELKLKLNKYKKTLNNCQIKLAAEILLDMSYSLNKYVQETEFWKNKDRKTFIISFLLRILCLYGHILQPFLPQTSARIYYLLGVESQYQQQALKLIEDDFEGYLLKCLQKSTGLKQPMLLFTEISLQRVNNLSLRFGRSEKKQQLKKETIKKEQKILQNNVKQQK